MIWNAMTFMCVAVLDNVDLTFYFIAALMELWINSLAGGDLKRHDIHVCRCTWQRWSPIILSAPSQSGTLLPLVKSPGVMFVYFIIVVAAILMLALAPMLELHLAQVCDEKRTQWCYIPLRWRHNKRTRWRLRSPASRLFTQRFIQA